MKHHLTALATPVALSTTPSAAEPVPFAQFAKVTPADSLVVGLDQRMLLPMRAAGRSQLRPVAVLPDGSTPLYPTENRARRPTGGPNGVSGMHAGREWTLRGPSEYQSDPVVGGNTRIETRLDESPGGAALEAPVGRHGDKPIPDGSPVSATGNVHIAAWTDSAFGVPKPGETNEVRDPPDHARLLATGFSMEAGRYACASIHELPRSPALNGGEDATRGTYHGVRLPALSQQRSGHRGNTRPGGDVAGRPGL